VVVNVGRGSVVDEVGADAAAEGASRRLFFFEAFASLRSAFLAAVASWR
jgi:hypothetical protein